MNAATKIAVKNGKESKTQLKTEPAARKRTHSAEGQKRRGRKTGAVLRLPFLKMQFLSA